MQEIESQEGHGEFTLSQVRLVYHNSLNVPKSLKSKVLFCDTNFLLLSMKHGSEQFKIRQALLSLGCGLAFNTTVHSELIHVARHEMIEHAMRTTKGLSRPLQGLLRGFDDGDVPHHSFVKKAVKKDIAFVQKVFGKDGLLLKQEVDRYLFGCEYFGTNTKIPVKASWSEVYRIAGEVGLDSSDAMIFNLVAHNSTFEGLITSDYDFDKTTFHIST